MDGFVEKFDPFIPKTVENRVYNLPKVGQDPLSTHPLSEMDNPLKRIYNACDPHKPATAEYYLDYAEARGSSPLTQEFRRHLELADDYRCFLLTGHIGCGKSSELEQLCRSLDSPDSPNDRYFPILLNASDYLDDYDTHTTDILLAIIVELAETLHRKIGIKLENNYLVKRLDDIKGFFLTDVEINEGHLSLWRAKQKVQRLKRAPDARGQVRDALKPKLPTLLEEINLLFDTARLAVKAVSLNEGQRPYTDLVLILDNLEKIRGFPEKKEGLESQHELFLKCASQLTGLHAHVIYTPPLQLVRSNEGQQLRRCYNADPFVLPPIKMTERGGRNPTLTGMDCMHNLLARRLGDLTLEEAFDADALDFLVICSGGHVRSLMSFVQAACTYADSIPIPLKVAYRAVQQTVRTYSTSIPEGHWEKLTELDLSVNQMILGGDADYLTMLDTLSILEYIEGGDDPFTFAEPWYAVNPIVREMQKFESAMRKISRSY